MSYFFNQAGAAWETLFAAETNGNGVSDPAYMDSTGTPIRYAAAAHGTPGPAVGFDITGNPNVDVGTIWARYGSVSAPAPAPAPTPAPAPSPTPAPAPAPVGPLPIDGQTYTQDAESHYENGKQTGAQATLTFGISGGVYSIQGSATFQSTTTKASGNIPAGAVSFQIVTLNFTNTYKAVLNNNVTSPVSVSSGLGMSLYCSYGNGSQDGAGSGTFQLNFFNSAGTNISQSTFTFSVDVGSTV